MDNTITDIIVKLTPIFVLIGLGVCIRYIGLLKDDTIDDLKKIIINISLPAILFFAFLNINLKISYIFIFILIFLFCIILYIFGFIVRKIFNMQNEYVPFLMTGFEFGMMGAVFFGAAFGIENMGYIGLIGLGHEFFIWFVYVTLLKKHAGGESNFFSTLKNFITSPVIIAIIAGLVFNILNLKSFMESFIISKAVFHSLQYLTGLTVPLILIIIGYNIKFDPVLFTKGSYLIFIRLLIILSIIIPVDLFVFKKLLKLDAIFSAALYIFVILPPPFILPLFIKKDNENEIQYVNGVLLLYSFVSIIIFSVYYILYSYRIL